MDLARQVINSGHSLRSQANIKVRQPLSKVQIAVPQKEKQQILSQLKEVIKDELNVKKVEILDSAEGFVKKTVKPNAKILGPKYGHKMKEIINAAREEQFELNQDQETITIAGETIQLAGNFEIQYLAKEGTLAESTNGIATILETELTEDLIQEGIARDTIRQIQEFRKEMDLEVDQRITVYIESKDKDFSQAITNFADIIREETLADELQQSGNFEWDNHKVSEINSIQVTIGIKKC
jgi:isoleucyl-tRNA synthetase